MGRDQRSSQVPKNSGGSYVPPEEVPEEGVQLRRFVMKEKICDMMKYAMPIVNTFPRRDRNTADIMRECMQSMLRYAIRLERKYYKKTTLEDLDIELAVLKEFIVIASDREYSGPKYAPPLSMHQREVWQRHTSEIGKMIGGYQKAISRKEDH